MPLLPIEPINNTGAVPFTAIGFAKPLCITIEHTYMGQYPKHKADVLFTSATKNPLITAAATTAVNCVRPGVQAHSNLEFDANQTGTPLVYYSDAIAWDSVVVTLQLVAKDGLQKTFDGLGQVFDKLSGLPVFTAASMYLLGARGLLHVADDLFFHGGEQVVFDETFTLHFNEPGFAPAQAGFSVLSPAGTSFPGYVFQPGAGLVDSAGEFYAGDTPYIVLSCDGTVREEYRGFQAKALDAALLKQFSTPAAASGQSATQDILSQLSTLYNDYQFRQKAMKLLQPGAPLSGPDATRLQAYIANIQDPAFRPAIPGGAHA